MVLHRTVFDLFARGLLGAVILLIVGIGSVVYAQHALRRAQTIAARIRRVSGIAFAISGTLLLLYIAQAYSRGPVTITAKLLTVLQDTCARSSRCYAIQFATTEPLAVLPETAMQMAVGRCYRVTYYPILIPFSRFDHLVLEVEQQENSACT
ncbi:MAG TPA: hypothetical protein VMK32_05235 [Burkholderiaceae bacterium]|nr:hypothetical protein [Burkholderiaceae bacterium]